MRPLERRYQELLATTGDMQFHLERLRKYASQCEHVTEFGVRNGVSSTALLAAQPKVMRSYDIQWCPVSELLAGMAGETDYSFTMADTTKMLEIEATDLLFIDTLHTYDCLKAELVRHGDKARQWIILHDTETYGVYGERNYELCTEVVGLMPAVHEFIEQGKFVIHEHIPECWGLTVLKRICN